MELFDKKFVHFMWEDELKGNEGFFADEINDLIVSVNENNTKCYDRVYKTEIDTYWFLRDKKNTDNRGVVYRFFYYDPRYEIKRAYLEGKSVQCYSHIGGWIDCKGVERLSYFDDEFEYRIKPEEPKEPEYRPFKDCDELIEVFRKKCEAEINCSTYFSTLYKACVWVKHNHYGVENLITAFDNDNESIGGSCVFIQDMWCDMAELFEQYTFLDGSPCGVLGA